MVQQQLKEESFIGNDSLADTMQRIDWTVKSMQYNFAIKHFQFLKVLYKYFWLTIGSKSGN